MAGLAQPNAYHCEQPARRAVRSLSFYRWAPPLLPLHARGWRGVHSALSASSGSPHDAVKLGAGICWPIFLYCWISLRRVSFSLSDTAHTFGEKSAQLGAQGPCSSTNEAGGKAGQGEGCGGGGGTERPGHDGRY